jgi:hypothetical protein
VTSPGKPPSNLDQSEQESRRLLDAVLRGERPMLFPPGTLAASVFVPLFAVGVGAVVSGVTLRAMNTPRSVAISMCVGAALLTGATIGHVSVFFGHLRSRVWLRRYVRVVLAGTTIVMALAAFGRVMVPWPLLGVAGTSFIGCDFLLGSRAYLGFASFMSLKRRYREDATKASARVLGKSRE